MGIHRVGLADAFGELKVKEAIPFLLENINMNREMLHADSGGGAEERYQADIKNKPAMTALTKIAELEPLQYAYRQNRLTWREREEVLIVICEIAETKSETYLLSLKAGLKQDLEKDLNPIDESLKRLVSPSRKIISKQRQSLSGYRLYGAERQRPQFLKIIASCGCSPSQGVPGGPGGQRPRVQGVKDP